MSGLSDLELVAQAMDSTNSRPSEPSPPPSVDTTQEVDLPADLADLDLSSLSPSELALLQPLIDALKVSDPDAEDGDETEADTEADDLRIAELLKQMDAAGDVADELEGKLDKLLESLGQAEKDIAEEVGAGKSEQTIEEE